MEQTDSELLQEIAKKDSRAFDWLYTRYMRLFQSWTYSRTKNEEISKDIVQNFWISIWNNPLYFKTDAQGSARKILLQFLSFQIINYLKSASGRIISDEKLLSEAETTISYSHIFEELEDEEIYVTIEKILDGLPRIAQDIFDLRARQQHSVKETASLLHVSEKTVHERYNWTLSILKGKLVKLYPQMNTGYHVYLLLLLLNELYS